MEWAGNGAKAQRTLGRAVEAGREQAWRLGLTAISLDGVASAAGLSRSGLLSRCRSAVELQVGIAADWRQEIERTACEAARSEGGVRGAWAFCREWLTHPAIRGAPVDVLRGDCSADSGAPDRRPRRSVAGALRVVFKALSAALEEARRSGDLLPGVDPEGIAFQLESLLLSWPWAARAFGVRRAVERIASACWAILEGACADLEAPLPPLSPELQRILGESPQSEVAPSCEGEDDPSPAFPGVSPLEF